MHRRLVLPCMLLMMSTASNATLIYDESVSGDSPFFFLGGVSLGPVASGDFVQGSVVIGNDIANDVDFDGYSFTLNGGVARILIEILASAGDTLNNWQLYPGPFTLAPVPGFDEELSLSNPLVSFDVADLSGTYLLGNNIQRGSSYDYRISFQEAGTVEPMPGPPTLGLFGLGIAALGLLRRKV